MAYDYNLVICEKIDKVLKITMNRPEVLNSLSRDLEKDIHAALDEGDADPEVRCMILAGAGRSFSPGYDMSTGPGREKSILDPSGFDSVGDFLTNTAISDYQNVHLLQLHLFRLNKPVISAIHGYCMGGAMWLAMACDMTYCNSLRALPGGSNRRGPPEPAFRCNPSPTPRRGSAAVWQSDSQPCFIRHISLLPPAMSR